MKHKFKLILAAGTAIALASGPIYAQDISSIEFGDDSGNWAQDGECDDPRFVGDGMANTTSREDILKDATDCRSLFEGGKIRLSDKQYDPTLTKVNGTDLGDDSYRWAKDGQCDDARFEGDGMAVTPSLDAIKKDLTDCSYGFQIGELTLASSLPDAPETSFDDIDFGNDKGAYTNDGECDDPRFAGKGMSTIGLSQENIGSDRKDCLALYKNKKIVFKANAVIDGYYFGDDASFYAGDGECDDPRFSGRGMSAKPTRAGIHHDATDCMDKWRANSIEPVKELNKNDFLIVEGLIFGDDSSQYAHDGECDDSGFTGRGVSGSASSEHAGKDQTDCLNAFRAGSVKRAPAIPVDTSITVDGIRFGDDASPFAKDGECDDSRFTGDGMATSFREEDANHDATDCLAAYQNGAIELK